MILSDSSDEYLYLIKKILLTHRDGRLFYLTKSNMTYYIHCKKRQKYNINII